MTTTDANIVAASRVPDVTRYIEAGISTELPTVDDIRTWLESKDLKSPPDNYSRFLSSYIPGTGSWTIASDAYTQWHNSAGTSVLWVRGAPGTGKSVWAASTAHRLAQEGQGPVLYFCFHQTSAIKRRSHAMVRSWMCQILNHSTLLQDMLRDKMKQFRDVERFSLSELWTDLQDCLHHSGGKVYCVADSLDELDVRDLDFIRRVIELRKHSPLSIKFAITSRPMARVEEVLEKSVVTQVTFEADRTNHDVKFYIENRLRAAQIPGIELSSVTKTIGHKAQGLFLYARLAVDNLDDHVLQANLTADNLEIWIETLPLSLYGLYSKLLEEQSSYSGIPQGQQKAILGWLCCSARPLRLLELAELVRHTSESPLTLEEGKNLVYASCGRLLQVLEDETLSVIHHSLLDFLASDFPSESRFAINGQFESTQREIEALHENIALTCVEYVNACCMEEMRLNMEDQHGSISSLTDQETEDINLQFPLLDYAENQWYHHASRAGWQSQALFSAVDQYFKLECWRVSTWPKETSSKVTILHVSAYYGLDHYLNHVLRSDVSVNVDAKDESGCSALSYAAQQGHAKVVEVLLEHGAEPNTTDLFGCSPIHYAVVGDFHDVVELLLQTGVDPCTKRVQPSTTHAYHAPKTLGGNRMIPGDSRVCPGDNPLTYVSEHGLIKSLLALVKCSTEESIVEALCRAAVYGRVDSLATLLKYMRDSIDSKFEGKTALYYAAARRDPATIDCLLNAGADPNALCFGGAFGHPRVIFHDRDVVHGEESQTPMHAFAGALHYHLVKSQWSPRNNREIIKRSFQLLIKAGGSLWMQDKFGRSALHHCVQSSGSQSMLIMELFLSTEAGKDLINCSQLSPLHCVQSNCPEMIAFLVRHGADINVPHVVTGCTPLHSVLLHSENATSCLQLLKYRPACNTSDKQGNTPLHAALASKDVNNEVIKTMLRLGASPNQRNNRGQTPLHVWNYKQKNSHLIPALLTAGANFELLDDDGKPFLFDILRHLLRDEAGLEELLQLGTPVHPRDLKGRSILHHAIMLGASSAILETLVKAGADSNWVDHAGNTILHEAVRRHPQLGGFGELGEKDRVVAAVSLGISISAANHSGQTVLHFAAGSTPSRFKACKEQEWEIFGFLTQSLHGLGVNTADHFGCQPIHYAASVSECHLNRLVRSGADPTALTNEGLSPLHIAAISRQSNIVGFLVHSYRQKQCISLVNLQDQSGRTALHYACRSGRPESVDILLNGGADPNIRDQHHMTPLHAVAEFPQENVCWGMIWNEVAGADRVDAGGLLLSDRTRTRSHGSPTAYTQKTRRREYEVTEHDNVRITDILRMLLSKGADIAFSGRKIDKPIDVAIATGCTEMVNELGRRGQKACDTFRQDCLRAGEPESENTLAEHFSTEDPHTLFRQLLFGGTERLVKKFFQLGADPLKSDSNGITPLHILAKWGYDSILSDLRPMWKPVISSELRPTLDDSTRRQFSSILEAACQRNLPNLSVIKILSEKFGVDFHSGDTFTILHLLCEASYWWQLEAIEYLISCGANIEGTNLSGETPLHVAVRDPIREGCWKLQAVETLLRKGANPNALDDAGLTCLSKTTNPDIVKLLVAYGLDVNIGKVPGIV